MCTKSVEKKWLQLVRTLPLMKELKKKFFSFERHWFFFFFNLLNCATRQNDYLDINICENVMKQKNKEMFIY